MTTYTLAGGCFWCLDAVFRKLQGVSESVCGYAGGTEADATYYQVASGKTGHAEAVQVTFDETIISKETILDIFFLIHDPTSLNQQGADKGPQYRSAMFYQNEDQKAEFEDAVRRAQENWDKAIVTERSKLEAFYAAEPEHQDYFSKNPTSGYCYVVIEPKVVKARKHYSNYFKEEA
ncbi:MAG TPA: peptide-methionine (S)-S-oxide reductase MsrA [Candidatus Saccharibacteria bacterium]|nr:peptide-methionine (S)-S-oxide reductase MsrA [Candidatus Saccharibacteria bacterium]HRK93812.1 peptide-methionine (S)-S-oxide reductase MsrA [Candidatus Saccharibacteria bacterium]